LFCLFCWDWVWTQAFMLTKQVLYCLSHTSSHFALFILEMGSRQLFAWAGLKPWPLGSQPPKKLGLQVWAAGARPLISLFFETESCFVAQTGLKLATLLPKPPKSLIAGVLPPCPAYNAFFSVNEWVKLLGAGYSGLWLAVDRPFPYAWKPGARNCQLGSPFLATDQTVLMAAQLFWTFYNHSENPLAAEDHCNWSQDSCFRRPCSSHECSRQSAQASEGSIPGKISLEF
jgi:hypothetical protein